MKEVVASRDLLVRDRSSGQATGISIEVGQPHWIDPEVQAGCVVHIVGLMSKPLTIFGSDLLGALKAALEFIDGELRRYAQTKSIEWLDGEPYFE